jgi:uncharacterized protein (DUF885 family)
MIRALLMLAFCAGGALFVAPLLVFPQTGSNTAEETRKFRVYLEEDWKRWMQEYPEAATFRGFPGQNRRWRDDLQEGLEARNGHLHESLAKLKSISRDALPAGEQLNYDLYRERLEIAEEGLQYGDDPFPFHPVVPFNLWMPMTQMDGVQQEMAATLAAMPHQTVTDYDDILARLETLPKHVEQHIELLREGLRRGYSPPKFMMRDVPKQVAGLIPADSLVSPLMEPFNKFPSQFPEADRARLTERAKQVYSSRIVPAVQKLHDYVAQSYVPACRESIAATALPNGSSAYAFHVRWQTTTNLTPQQIHEIGLSEVKRIRAVMDKVIASTGFKGSFHDFAEFLRTDTRFFYDQPDDLVNGYRIITKKIDPELAHEFGKLPRLPYGVCVIPDFKAPSQTTAYYQAGAPAAGRPGCYFVNTYNLRARPKWEMEALSLHEAVPGHHLQISLAQEQEGQPEFRKHSGYSAYVEGWGLYAESLGEELGMYKDPYSKFGQLSYEMWRAVRLVVDTGMHSMGWTRQQAIDFFRENTGKTDQDITVEVDRYIVWPGQALAYKIGQMKIRELRTEAEKRLGAKFDVRQFHDAVLENGSVPLSVLEARMKQWMDSRTAH